MPADFDIVRNVKDCPDEKVEIVCLKNYEENQKSQCGEKIDLSKFDKDLQEVEIRSGEIVHMCWPRKGCPKKRCDDE